MINVIKTTLELLQKIRDEDIVHVKFLKKDGTERTMRCTLNFDRVPLSDKPKDVNIPQIMKLAQKSKIIHVYDLDKQGWRSLPFERSEWLRDNKDKMYRIVSANK